MIVGDAMNRIEEVLNEKPLSESKVNNVPSDHSITLEHVIYSYDGEKNALNDVSMSIKPGRTIALVGSSGGGKTTLANIVTRFLIHRRAYIDREYRYTRHSKRNIDE